MKQEQNPMEVDLFSVQKNQLNSLLEKLKNDAEMYKEHLINAFAELFQNFNNQDDSSKKNNLNNFFDYLLKYFTLNSRIDEVEKNISFTEEMDNQFKNSNEGPNANAQEMDVIQEENNNNPNGDNNIKSKKY